MFLSFLQMCRFTRAEFTEGFRGLKVDSIRAMHIRLPEVAAEIMTRPGENLVWAFSGNISRASVLIAENVFSASITIWGHIRQVRC